MALDRQSIEKQFPLGSHGYDPQAVDAHLSTLADEIAEFKSTARRRSETLASSASEQVRAIIDAAETSAAEMLRLAEAEAQEIRADAHHEAHGTREGAAQEVRDHVSRVSEATAAMLGRLDGMESELSGLIEALRNGATRLDGDLRELELDLGRVEETARPSSRAEFEPDPAPEPDPGVSPPDSGWGSGGGTESWESSSAAEGTGPGGSASWDAGPSSAGWGVPEHPEETAAEESSPAESWEATRPSETPEQAEPGAEAGTTAAPGAAAFPKPGSAPPGEPVPARYGEPSPGSSAGADPGAGGEPHQQPQAEPDPETDDAEGARLIALNMALNGSPREETARYLSENFQLADREGLLDEVYASVES